jgi:hypothetical protein
MKAVEHSEVYFNVSTEIKYEFNLQDSDCLVTRLQNETIKVANKSIKHGNKGKKSKFNSGRK